LDDITRWLVSGQSWKYLERSEIVTKNIIDFIDRMALFFSRLIRRCEEKRRSDIRQALSRETGFSYTESYCFVIILIEHGIFITEVFSNSTYDGEREFVST
jgi:hypothetical protein